MSKAEKMFKEIKIKKTPNADTRTMKRLDYDLVLTDTYNHLFAVRETMNWIAAKLEKQGLKHDFTKVGEYYDSFYEALENGMKGNNFYEHEWWGTHITKERHHLGIDGRVPNDVNLLDVLEMVVDITVAGLARSGEVFDVKISNDTLQLAYKNTIELLKKNIEVIEDE